MRHCRRRSRRRRESGSVCCSRVLERRTRQPLDRPQPSFPRRRASMGVRGHVCRGNGHGNCRPPHHHSDAAGKPLPSRKRIDHEPVTRSRTPDTTSPRREFQTVRSEGGLLPPDPLRGFLDRRSSLAGTRPGDYGLSPGESQNEVITHSWNRLRRHYGEFRAAAADKTGQRRRWGVRIDAEEESA